MRKRILTLEEAKAINQDGNFPSDFPPELYGKLLTVNQSSELEHPVGITTVTKNGVGYNIFRSMTKNEIPFKITKY